jgi:hypothetical protein
VSEFTVSVFRIKIKAKEKIDLPYFPGSVLRGAFGASLRRMTCVVKTEDCNQCILNQKCVYATSFESIFSGDSPYLKGTTKAPHPVMVYPLQLGDKVYRKGGTYTFGMTVFGERRDYLPYYIYAVSRLGEMGLGKTRGRFSILSVKEMINHRGWREIYHENSETLLNDGQGISIEQVLRRRTRQKRLVLETKTPLRIKNSGKLTEEPALSQIVQGVLFRLRVLSSLYSDEPLDLLSNINLNELSKGVMVEHANFRWMDHGRYSKRQNAKMKLGGAMGTMVITGNLNKVYPILKAGELIHIGKNTAFGLGRYTVRGG